MSSRLNKVFTIFLGGVSSSEDDEDDVSESSSESSLEPLEFVVFIAHFPFKPPLTRGPDLPIFGKFCYQYKELN